MLWSYKGIRKRDFINCGQSINEMPTWVHDAFGSWVESLGYGGGKQGFGYNDNVIIGKCKTIHGNTFDYHCYIIEKSEGKFHHGDPTFIIKNKATGEIMFRHKNGIFSKHRDI